MLKTWLRELPSEIFPQELQHSLAVELQKENPNFNMMGQPAPQRLRDVLSELLSPGIAIPAGAMLAAFFLAVTSGQFEWSPARTTPRPIANQLAPIPREATALASGSSTGGTRGWATSTMRWAGAALHPLFLRETHQDTRTRSSSHVTSTTAVILKSPDLLHFTEEDIITRPKRRAGCSGSPCHAFLRRRSQWLSAQARACAD